MGVEMGMTSEVGLTPWSVPLFLVVELQHALNVKVHIDMFAWLLVARFALRLPFPLLPKREDKLQKQWTAGGAMLVGPSKPKVREALQSQR